MSQQDIVDALVREQGTLFSESMGCDLSKDTPDEWFAWLEGTILLSARIDHELAIEAGQALRNEGFHTVSGVLDASEDALIACLGENGYKRYRIVATGYLRHAAELVRDRYDDDLRKMIDDTPSAADIRARLQDVKGIGEVGADIFTREAQLVWDKLYPELGQAARDQAEAMGLTTDHGPLVSMAGSRENFVRLAAALTRASIGEAASDVDDAVEQAE